MKQVSGHLSEYLFQFLIGGTLMVLLFYFSKQKNTVICALIPTLPILFLIGLFYLYKFKGDLKHYIINASIYILFYLVFLVMLFIIFYNSKKIVLSTAIALFLYIIIIISSIYING